MSVRNVSAGYKVYGLINPQLVSTTTALTGSVQLNPGDEQDCMAVVQLGNPTAAVTVTTSTVVVTIAASATQNGTYTTLATLTATTGNSPQCFNARVLINQGLYTWVKATAQLGFSNGTIPLAVSFVSQQTIATDSNITAAA